MTAHLFLAPAAAGKTTYALKVARQRSEKLGAEVRVCVPSRLQAASWRRRLAEEGGALGVRVMTFDELYGACLAEVGESYTRLSQPVQYRLIGNLVDRAPLVHYASLRDRPGFILVLQAFISELKAARIFPERFLDAVAAQGGEPRLRELGQLYAAYQEELLKNDWADYAGIGWLAVEALEKRAPDVGRSWPLLIVDGFDNFTEIQLALLQLLAQRAGSLVITMTGEAGREKPRVVHRRFHNARLKLEERLKILAESLPEPYIQPSSVLAHLERNLFSGSPSAVNDPGAITLIEAPDRSTEVRTALRWLKERLQPGGYCPGEVALIARDLAPYRPFIVEIAAEYGLPIRLADGLPLRSNPAVVAMLNLLRLVLPLRGNVDDFALPRTGVVAAWRSPYFDWTNVLAEKEAPEPIGINPADAETLDIAARWGRVIGGYAQWQETLSALAGRGRRKLPGERSDLPENVVAGPQASQLASKFLAFFMRIMPPQGNNRYQDYVSWLEGLIGSDARAGDSTQDLDRPSSLNMIPRILAGEEAAAELDLAALRRVKDILRGLIWAEETDAESRTVDYMTFLAELTGAIEATTYQPPLPLDKEAILVSSAIRSRGLPFWAVALLGLAEGEFPAVLGEDPFLREADRVHFRQESGLPLTSSIESAEQEFFYEVITSPREQLLITRPRLSDTGAEWLASPFWEEICRLVPVEAKSLTTESVPVPAEASSLPELLESLVKYPGQQQARRWVREEHPQSWATVEKAGPIFRSRYQQIRSVYDGDLSQYSGTFTDRFPPEFRWSPSSLESYRSCAFIFFTGRVLGLEPRQEPAIGFDAAQRGTIYHEILEALYAQLEPAERTDTDKLLVLLPAVAAPILDAAPEKQGFREVAWWEQIKREIQENVARTISALAEMPGDFIPTYFEARFFGDQALTVFEGGDFFRVHGIVDRVDQNPAGQIRVIDYKTSGSSAYSKRSLELGEKLQLPLYALAARDALNLGEPVEGFYWHISPAEASGLTLADFGPEEAMQTAVDYAWEAVRGARLGAFHPQAPLGGCPQWCPAASFCWQYRARARR